MIFHIKKLYISISWYFFIMIAWVILTNKIESFLLCLSALIIHEMGHIITIFLLKEKISIFYILPFGFCCRLKNQNKMKLNISNEKFKKYGSFDLLEEIVFADTFLNYTDNYDEIVILNLLVCDGEPKRIFRNAIFSREYNEIGIAVNLWDNDIKIGIEIITAKNFVSKCKIKDGLLTELENKAQSFQEKKQKIIEEAENEINERVKKSDLYTNKNYFDIKEEKHVFFNEELNLLSVYKTFLFLYENGGESEISISKAIKCE